MTKQQTIGELILERREARLMSVRRLAAALGLAPNTVYRHQEGTNIPHLDTLADYCRELTIEEAVARAAVAESRRRAGK